MGLHSLIVQNVETKALMLASLLAMGSAGCTTVYTARGGYSHAISSDVADAGQLDVGLGFGIADSTGVVADMNLLRSKFGPEIFHLGVYPGVIVNIFATKQVTVNLSTGFEFAGIDVVRGEPSFSIASPFGDLGFGFRPDGSADWLLNLAFGGEYRIRTRDVVPNAGYLNMTFGITYLDD